MPQALGGLIKVVLSQSYGGKLAQNVFWYHHTADQKAPSLAGFITSWDTVMMGPLASAQSNLLSYDLIEAVDVTDILAPASAVPSVSTGIVVGSELPNYVAAGFQLQRTTTETRNGSKRLTGMIEENVLFNQWEAAYQPTLNAVALALNTNIVVGASTYEPVIARPPDGITQLNYIYNPVSTVISKSFCTTQNSRKRRS